MSAVSPNAPGLQWMMELLNGSDSRFQEEMRMTKQEWSSLIPFLQEHCGLHPLGEVDLIESVGMFIKIVGGGATHSEVGEIFNHSDETVSRHAYHVLEPMCVLADIMVAPVAKNFDEIPQQIREDNRFHPYFDGCIGAIDSTHVASQSTDRHGLHILAVCDFNLCIMFADIREEGSMLDSEILMESMRTTANQFPSFPIPPSGKYFLADFKFPLVLGVLTPYKNERYYLSEFSEESQIRNRNENFNYVHSSLRSPAVEQMFGILKGKWKILNGMPNYDLTTQIPFVWACIGLHNFLRRHATDGFDMVTEELLRSYQGYVYNNKMVLMVIGNGVSPSF